LGWAHRQASPAVTNGFKDMLKACCVDRVIDRTMYDFRLGAGAATPHKLMGIWTIPRWRRRLRIGLMRL